MLIFENIKFLIRNCFISHRKKDRDREKESKNNDGDESTSSLLSGQEGVTGFTARNDAHGVITNNMITLSILPSIYLLISIFTILILLFLKFKGKIVLNSDAVVNNMIIPNYYDLQKINPTIYHIYTCITSFAGIAIVFILFSVLKQRFKVPEYQNHNFKLYIMVIFGFISNFLNFAKGFSPYIENYELIVKKIEENIKIDLSHLLFLTFIFFTVLFSIYSIYILDLLRGDKNNESNDIFLSTSYRNRNQDDNWFNYKIVILCYLCIFTLVYVVFLLHNNKIFIFWNSLNSLIDENLSFVICFFPYFIHTINAVLMFSFYFEMKYVNLALSQNLEVDYLFEDGAEKLLI
jgi:hypothetical protein